MLNVMMLIRTQIILFLSPGSVNPLRKEAGPVVRHA